jgi:uncharacterized membrane protein
MNRLYNPNYLNAALFILMAGAIYFVITTSTNLPLQMASHFNAEGIADGFMSQEGYTNTMLALIVLVPGLLALTPLGMRKLPANLINIPHKEYWLTPERRELTFQTLHRFMSVMACFLLLFLSYVHWLVIQANERQPPAMSVLNFFLGMIVFLLLSGIWSLLLHRQFKLTDPTQV